MLGVLVGSDKTAVVVLAFVGFVRACWIGNASMVSSLFVGYLGYGSFCDESESQSAFPETQTRFDGSLLAL